MCRYATNIQWHINRDYTCTSSAAVPVYRLVEQGEEYESYSQLPDLFSIEATGNNATLYISGITNRSNNVTVTCGNIDLSLGSSFRNILFTVILEFACKFSNHH